MKKCKNCGFESEGIYCPECGQEVTPKRLTVKLVFKDSTHRFFNMENPGANTIFRLLTKPGETAKNYVSGAKKLLIKPYKLFLTWQTIHVLFYHWMSKNYYNEQIAKNTGNIAEKKELIEVQQLILNDIRYLDYMIPLFFAVFFHWFYRKKTGINFAESLSVSFYWISITLIFSIIFMSLSLLNTKFWSFPIIINTIYLTFATMRFSRNLKFSGALKGLATVIISYSAYFFTVYFFILLYLNFFSK